MAKVFVRKGRLLAVVRFKGRAAGLQIALEIWLPPHAASGEPDVR